MRQSVAVIILAALFASFTPVLAEEFTPDLKAVTGKWVGIFTRRDGFKGPSTLTVEEDGTWEVNIPGLKPNERATGTVRVKNGVYRWKSGTTSRAGTWTLRTGDGDRQTLIVDSDDRKTRSQYNR